MLRLILSDRSSSHHSRRAKAAFTACSDFHAKISKVCLSHRHIHITPGRKEYPQDLLGASRDYCNLIKKGTFATGLLQRPTKMTTAAIVGCCS